MTLDPALHPRGQPHLSAASGLVCANGRAYVLADDEHQLAIFSDRATPGSLHRVVPGTLPMVKGARKKRKPDFEALLHLPASAPGAASSAGVLAGFGSGSRPNRQRGALLALDSWGLPLLPARSIDLRPLYEPLEARLGQINIEGAFVLGDDLLLLHRGSGGSDNLALHVRLADFLAVLDGRSDAVEPHSIEAYELGAIDGVALGMTDGAALADGRWLFTAVAEATDDAYADGACRGAGLRGGRWALAVDAPAGPAGQG